MTLNILNFIFIFAGSHRKKWRAEEHEVVLQHFEKDIRLLRVPGKRDCELCKKKNPLLQNRTWSDIKFHVYNRVQILRKKPNHF